MLHVMLMFKFIKQSNQSYWSEEIAYIQHDQENHKNNMEKMKTTETIVKLQRTIEIIAHQVIKTCIICSNNICIKFDKQEI